MCCTCVEKQIDNRGKGNYDIVNWGHKNTLTATVCLLLHLDVPSGSERVIQSNKHYISLIFLSHSHLAKLVHVLKM